MARNANNPTFILGTGQADELGSEPGNAVIFAGSGSDDIRAGQDAIQFRAAALWPWRRPPVTPALSVTAAPGPEGDAVLHFDHGATATLLSVPAARVAAHLRDCVKAG